MAARLAIALAALLLRVADSTVVCPSLLPAGTLRTCVVTDEHQPSSVVMRDASGKTALVAAAGASADMQVFDVPKDMPLATYVVAVTYADGTVETTDVEVVAVFPMTFIETDKHMYRAGQTVRFRTLVLNYEGSAPVGNATMNLQVEGPSGFQLMAVSKVTDASGVAQFEFPLRREPEYGTYKVKTRAAADHWTGAAEFVVGEYVPPRFEVKVEVDQQSVQIGDVTSVTITGRVSAKYTFGKDVQGQADVTLFKGENRITIAGGLKGTELEQELDITGSRPTGEARLGRSFSINIDGDAEFVMVFDANPLLVGSRIVVNATVTDSLTLEEQSGFAAVPVHHAGDFAVPHISLADGGTSVKAGLPISVHARLLQMDGMPSQIPSVINRQYTLVAIFYRNMDYFGPPAPRVSKTVGGRALASEAGAVVEVPWLPEDSSCCNMSATGELQGDYMDATACCVVQVDVQLELDGTRLKVFNPFLGWVEQPEQTPCFSREYSPTGHFLQVLPPAKVSSARFALLVRSTLSLDELQRSVKYVAVHRGLAVAAGEGELQSVNSTSGMHFTGSLWVTIPESVMGDMKIFVIARRLEDGASVMGEMAFKRELQWPFSLNVEFSETEVAPGAGLGVNVKVQGLAPEEPVHVFLASLDRSTELLGQRAVVSEGAFDTEINKTRVQPSIPKFSLASICETFGPDTALYMSLAREGLMPSAANFSLFLMEDMVENVHQHLRPMPPMCLRLLHDGCTLNPYARTGGIPFFPPPPMPNTVSDAVTDDSASAAVRRFFPETWLWKRLDLVDRSSTDPVTVFPVVAPDTITSWSLEAFATSAKGLSIAKPPERLTVFKNFFVEALLPSSCIRGEALQIVMAFHDYGQRQDAKHLYSSIGFVDGEVELLEGQRAVTVDNSVSNRIVWVRPLVPGTLKLWFVLRALDSEGNSLAEDAMEKPLRVLAEGIPVSSFVTLDFSLRTVTYEALETVQLSLPVNYVRGSAALYASVTGDVLIPSLEGLDSLIKLPVGCGEQTLATLAPNIYIASYLQSMDQLDSWTRERLTKNIMTGLAGMMTFRHSNASFSGYGERDMHGSTWLTAFAVKVFVEAMHSGLTVVDTDVITSAVEFLVAMQQPDGRFEEDGMVIHRAMQGGVFVQDQPVDDTKTDRVASERIPAPDSSLTAYVLSVLAIVPKTLLGLDTGALDNAIAKAVEYVQGQQVERTTFAQVLRIYALMKAGALPAADLPVVLRKLLSLAGESRAGALLWPGESEAVVVETTSYAALTLVAAGSVDFSGSIIKGLVGLRSVHGGFASTQDTVLALEALAALAAQGHSPDSSMSLEVGLASAPAVKLRVDQENRRLLQDAQLSLPAAADLQPGELPVQVKASGIGGAYVMVNLAYNVAEPPSSNCFDIAVRWLQPPNTTNVVTVRGCILVLDGCNPQKSGGMWIVSVGLYTGFSPSTRTLMDLVTSGKVKKYETTERSVELYVDDLGLDGDGRAREVCYEFIVTKDREVEDVAAVPTTVTDYYDPQNSSTVLSRYRPVTITDDGEEVEVELGPGFKSRGTGGGGGDTDAGGSDLGEGSQEASVAARLISGPLLLALVALGGVVL